MNSIIQRNLPAPGSYNYSNYNKKQGKSLVYLFIFKKKKRKMYF